MTIGNPLREEPKPQEVATIKRLGLVGLVLVAIKSALARKKVEVKNVERKIEPCHTNVGFVRNHPMMNYDDDGED